MYEHAERIYPRRECGYCVDDVARALVVVCRDHATAELDDLREQYLTFVLAAQEPDGRFHNRRRFDLGWTDTASVEDCWGRALWGLGTACARVPHLRDRALEGFDRGAALRSPHPRAMAFAALGAAEVLAAVPGHVEARALITAAVRVIGRPALGSRWPWPEPRLSYANAVLPEALLVAGRALDSPRAPRGRPRPVGAGCSTGRLRDGHLSVVPAGGGDREKPDRHSTSSRSRWPRWPTLVRGRTRSTDDGWWAQGVELAAAWFLGDNDSRTPMHDPVTGGGFDGLERFGRNENQGAESTLAALVDAAAGRAHGGPALVKSAGDGVRHADRRDTDRRPGAGAGAAVRARSRALPRWSVPGIGGAVADPRAARRRGRRDLEAGR